MFSGIGTKSCATTILRGGLSLHSLPWRPARCRRPWELQLGPADVEAQARSLGTDKHASIIDLRTRNVIIILVFVIVIVCLMLLWVWALRCGIIANGTVSDCGFRCRSKM